MKPLAAAAAACLLLAGCREGAAQENAAVSEAGLRIVPVTVRSAGGAHVFTAEVADTPERQERGLMYRTELAPDAGMLFTFDPPRPASFWMRNTLIPLDMIFVRADGTIAYIAVNALPGSTEPVGIPEPVAAVLEIAGGRSAELGMGEGDRASWPGGPSI